MYMPGKLLFWTFSSRCAAPSPLLAAAMELHQTSQNTIERVRVKECSSLNKTFRLARACPSQQTANQRTQRTQRQKRQKRQKPPLSPTHAPIISHQFHPVAVSL